MSGKVPPSSVKKAGDLYREFSGHEPDEVVKIKKPVMPNTLLVVGELEGVIYSTVRDDEHERYIHKFRKSSRPLLCASPDGKQLFLIEGNYEFTDRGIVDK